MAAEEKVTPPVVDPVDPPITTNDDAFGSAWDEATAPTMTPPVAKEPEAKTPPAAKEPEAKTPPVETPPAKTAEEIALEKKAVDDAAEAKRVADAAAATPPAATETPPAETPPAEPAPPKPYEFTTEEKEALTAYEKEWPELAAAQSIVITAAMYNGLQYAFTEIHKQYDPVMRRFEALGDMMEEQLTLIELRAGVPDYDVIYNDIEPWIKTLPAAHRRGAEQVWKEGTTAEVVDLCKEFKKMKAPAAAAPPPAPKAPPKELSEAAKRAAAKLTAVEGGRTAAVTAPDPNDFDSAWKELTAED